MHRHIDRLYEISKKQSRIIIGLMSGTSLDGLDIAVCHITGSGITTQAEIQHFTTVSYDEMFKAEVRQIFSKKTIDLEKLCLLNAFIGNYHAKLILENLRTWNIHRDDIDCIASHGQTIYHAPKRLHQFEEYPNATLQIGDGDHIAVGTGIITLSDFRQKHVAAGGEGAPLALYGDYLLFTSVAENRILLNIGGIANFTFLPKGGDPSKIISTDTGPGNTLIDAAAQKYFNISFDQDAQIARTGQVIPELLNDLLSHPFFNQAMPKTTGPELFNIAFFDDVLSRLNINVSNPADLLATLTELSALSIAHSIKFYANFEPVIYMSGGGFHNPLLIARLQELLPSLHFRETMALGIDPDAKEALLFAILANETLSGSRVSFDNAPSITMGKISFPD